MKKQIQKTFVFLLTMCMVLALTPVTALAANIEINDLSKGNRVSSGDTINVNSAISFTIKYRDCNYNIIEEDVINVSESGPLSLEIKNYTGAPAGYHKYKWIVFGITTQYINNFKSVNLYLELCPIDYYINYHDGSDWLGEDVFTVETDNHFNSTASKPGYILKGWDIDPAGNTVVFAPGAEVEDSFLTYQVGDNSLENPFKLYAVWEYTGIGDVPATADDSNMPLWCALFALFAAVLILSGKKRKKA